MKTKTQMMTNYGMHAVHASETLPLAGLVHWGANPRHENESEVDALMESLAAVGQLDDLHVWRCVDGDKVLRGNRRLAAMREMGWTEARQIVHEFSDERARLVARIAQDVAGVGGEIERLAAGRFVQMHEFMARWRARQ